MILLRSPIQTLRESAARAVSFAIVDDLLTNLYELTRLAAIASNNANDGSSHALCSVGSCPNYCQYARVKVAGLYNSI